jgi:hypothetical protein
VDDFCKARAARGRAGRLARPDLTGVKSGDKRISQLFMLKRTLLPA